MGKMIMEYKDVVDEMKLVKDYFDTDNVFLYTADTDINTINNKSIVFDATFEGLKADSNFHYLDVTLIVYVLGYLDDKFFIDNDYIRQDTITRNQNQQYASVYQKHLAVIV